MAWDMNRVNLVGRLTRDVEMRYTSSGVAVAKFGLAVGGRKENEVSFFDIVVWDKTAENCDKYINKGKQVGIDGHLQQNIWDAKDGSKRSKVEIVADKVQFLGSKDDGNNNQNGNQPSQQNNQNQQQNGNQQSPSQNNGDDGWRDISEQHDGQSNNDNVPF